MKAIDAQAAFGADQWAMRDGQCPEHGKFSAFAQRDGSVICPRCHDAKLDLIAQRRAFEERRGHLRSISFVPHRFSAVGFKDWIPSTSSAESVRASVMSYYRDIRDTPRQWRSLWLTGLPGTGKTHLLCALVRALVEVGVSARYVTLAAMLAEIKEAYSANDKTEAGQIAKFANSFDFLVIDEIDVMRASDNDKALLFAVINGRYNELRPVAVASNQSPDLLSEYVTERVADRLRENAAIMVCDWASARGREAA